MEEADKTSEVEHPRTPSGADSDRNLEPVGSVAASIGMPPAFWMTYDDHRTLFDSWEQKNELFDEPLDDCIELYCDGLPLDEYALGNARNFLMEELGAR